MAVAWSRPATGLANAAPTDDNYDVEAQARLDAFFDVDLYSEFFKEYGGRQLPPKEGMINALVNKFGVAGKQAPNVLARLLDSADQAGLFSIAGARTKLIRPQSEPVVTMPWMMDSPGSRMVSTSRDNSRPSKHLVMSPRSSRIVTRS